MQEPQFNEEQQAYIAELRSTLRGEFIATEDGKSPKATLEQLEDLKQDALMALKHTLKFGDNESIKAKVAMWTISTILDAQKANDSPLAEFLKGLPTTPQVDIHH